MCSLLSPNNFFLLLPMTNFCLLLTRFLYFSDLDDLVQMPPTPPSSHGSDSDGSQSPRSLPPSSPARPTARSSTAISSSPLLTAPHVSKEKSVRFNCHARLPHHLYYPAIILGGQDLKLLLYIHPHRVQIQLLDAFFCSAFKVWFSCHLNCCFPNCLLCFVVVFF